MPAGQNVLTLLQKKFLRWGFKALNEQETIELLLSIILPRQESKQRAKEYANKFGTLRGLLSASNTELEQAGIDSQSVFLLKVLHELPMKLLQEKIIEQPVRQSSQEIFDYLSYSMRDLKKEVFKVIVVNNRNQIVETTDLFQGTVNKITIHPREILELCVKDDATALMFAHNHPAGDPSPSKSDKRLTRDLVYMGYIVQTKVLDHIIIGSNRYFSFADAGLIRKYEDEFLNMRIKSVYERGN